MRQIRRWALSIVAALLLYYLFTAICSIHEAILGILFAISATAFSQLTWRASGIQFSPTLRDLSYAWRIPWYILTDAWLISLVLIEDLAGIRAAGSFSRAARFESASPPCAVLATTFATISPNSIVIGVDEERRLFLFHQLRQTPISRMTINLGAKA